MSKIVVRAVWAIACSYIVDDNPLNVIRAFSNDAVVAVEEWEGLLVTVACSSSQLSISASWNSSAHLECLVPVRNCRVMTLAHVEHSIECTIVANSSWLANSHGVHVRHIVAHASAIHQHIAVNACRFTDVVVDDAAVRAYALVDDVIPDEAVNPVASRLSASEFVFSCVTGWNDMPGCVDADTFVIDQGRFAFASDR